MVTIDPFQAQRYVLRDYQYRIERLEKRLALTPTQAQITAAATATVFPGRNVLDNGAMNTTQRGVGPVTGIAVTGYYTADRWKAYMSTPGTGVFSQDVIADAPVSTLFTNSLRMKTTTVNASPATTMEINLSQSVEGFNCQQFMIGTPNATAITVQFWVKSSITGVFNVELYNPAGPRYVSKQYTIPVPDTWSFVTVTFPPDAFGTAPPNTSASGLSLQWFLGNGTDETSGIQTGLWGATPANRAVLNTNLLATLNATWQITGVQMEVGVNATPFEVIPYADRLARCQRTYFRVTGTAAAGVLTSLGTAYTTSAGYFSVTPPVRMRAIPTLATSGTATDYRLTDGATGTTCTGVPSLNGDTTVDQLMVIASTAATLTQFRPYYLASNLTANAFLGFSADL